jgi:hypothetical protein
MNILHMKRKLLPLGNPQMDGGGGGGGGQQQTTTSDVADWAKPTAERTLGKAEALATDKPYQSYGNWAQQTGADPNRVAGFNSLQNQSFQGAQNLQPSQGLNSAMNLAGAGSMNSLNAGQNYMNMATNPNAMQGFMSPYMQNVVNSQMGEANRNYDISGTNQASQATQAGAFGGSRGAIMAAENERNRNTALNGIQATGLQNAFQNAQQAQQFGSSLGLQGAGQAIQGAGQMANIGTQQFGQQKDTLNLQNQFGGQQQANEQAKLGYNMQDYTQQQQYPYQQLSFLSNIMHGLPTGNVQTMYGMQPTTAQSIGSLGMGAYGMSQLMRADGGTVSSYADGGSVESPNAIEGIVSKLSDDQLKQAAKSAQARGDVQELQAIQQEMAMRASERNGMAGAFNQLPQGQQESMAGGGIVAFAMPTAANNYGLTDSSEDDAPQQGEAAMTSEGNPKAYNQFSQQMLAHIGRMQKEKGYTPMTRAEQMAAEKSDYEDMTRFAGPDPYAPMQERLKQQETDRAGSLSEGRGLAALQAAAAMSQGRGLVQGLGRAGGAFAESYGQALRADAAEKRSLAQMQFNLSDAQRKERMGLTKEARANVQAAETNKYNAIKSGRERDAAVANALGKGLQGTKPLRATGASKEPKINEQLAAAEIAHETNPTDATLSRVTALRRAVGQTKTTDYGPTRAGLGESQLAVKLGEDINTAQQKLKFTPEYVKADAATKTQMMKDAATQVRANAAKNATVNNNSPQAGQNDYSNLWGGTGG